MKKDTEVDEEETVYFWRCIPVGFGTGNHIDECLEYWTDKSETLVDGELTKTWVQTKDLGLYKNNRRSVHCKRCDTNYTLLKTGLTPAQKYTP